ncbi:hypothetical protein NEAUS06_0532 [Nematocida ausubeli]|nr:hypothetical protein NEAUS06_0532 [Nematocida ausubeli]
MVAVTEYVFTASQYFRVIIYGMLILSGKVCSALKNLAVIQHIGGKEGAKIILFSVSQMVLSLRELLILPLEKYYIKKQVTTVHNQIIDVLDAEPDAEESISKLLVEKAAKIKIAESRIKYRKKYLVYGLKSILIVYMLFQMVYYIFAATLVFLVADVCIKLRMQREEEEIAHIICEYDVKQDHMYRSLRYLERPAEQSPTHREKESIVTKVLAEHKKSYQEYLIQHIQAAFIRSGWIVLGCILFQLYFAGSVHLLQISGKNTDLFIVIYKKIEKLSNGFIKFL